MPSEGRDYALVERGRGMGMIRTIAVEGQPAPDFTLPSLTGGEVRLSEFIGKKVILFMWASW
jgi:hypothetical protein